MDFLTVGLFFSHLFLHFGDCREVFADRVEDHDNNDDSGNNRRNQETNDIGGLDGGFRLTEGSQLGVELGKGQDEQHAGIDQGGAALKRKALDGGDNRVELLSFLEHDKVDGVVDQEVGQCVDHSANHGGDKAHHAAVHEVHAAGEEQKQIDGNGQDLRPEHRLPAALEELEEDGHEHHHGDQCTDGNEAHVRRNRAANGRADGCLVHHGKIDTQRCPDVLCIVNGGGKHEAVGNRGADPYHDDGPDFLMTEEVAELLETAAVLALHDILFLGSLEQTPEADDGEEGIDKHQVPVAAEDLNKLGREGGGNGKHERHDRRADGQNPVALAVIQCHGRENGLPWHRICRHNHAVHHVPRTGPDALAHGAGCKEGGV